jgi:alpha-ketoglutarate-dependent taurine dioxygenase
MTKVLERGSSSSNRRELIDRLLKAKGINLPEAETIPRRPDGKPCPLSFAQERLWFVDQLNPRSPAYNLCRALCLTGRLEVGALKRSLNRIVARHEVLRTCFVQRVGSPFQQVLETLELDLPVIDLSELTSEQRRQQSHQISTAEANSGFDLSRAPLLRALLIREAEQEHVLVVTMHHIISDGWSIGVMVRELGEIYRAEIERREAKIEELQVQYGDYAEWQREWLKGEVLEQELGYWKEQLADAPHILDLPTDYPRRETLSARGSYQQFLLDESFSEAIRALGSEEAATPFMVLMSAFQLLLYRYSGQDNFLIGADVAGRNRAQIEPLIGFFINMLVTRADLSGDPTFRGLLRRVRDMSLAAYAHQDMPFDKIVEELQPARNLSYTPLFQVVFNFNSAVNLNLSLELPGLQISPQPYDFDLVRFDLSLFVNAIGRGFVGSWRYRVDLFKPETIQRMSARFEALLREVVARPDARLSTFDLLHEDEKREQAETKKQIRASSFTKFKKAVPKSLTTEKRSLVTTGLLESGQLLPLVVRPAVADVDLISWASQNLAFIDESLLKHGAILFREFGLTAHAELEHFARMTSQGLIDYSEPSSPRTEVAQKIYTSTDYPASQWIELHNEMSYSHNWPAKIYFFCATAAEAGGETPIAFSQKVLNLLDPKIVNDFARKKVMYLRNYGEGLGLTWQHVFNTTDRSVVEAQCKRAGIEFEWRDNERLRTRQVHEALARHPKTAEELWFNQAHSFHVSALAPEVRESLLSLFKEDDLPSNAFYGDGSRIEDSVIKEICHVYREAAVCFAWQKGDLLMVDNMLVAHGRAPFTGSRRILVAMADKIEARGLAQKVSH